MDLNLFKVFDALIEEENASRAAIKLGVSQSAVSAALGRLRNVYHDPLFTRVQGGLKPTSRAIELKPYVQDILSSVSKSLTLEDRDKPSGFVKLGMSDDIEIAFGAEIISGVRQLFPGITLVIKQSNSEVAAQLLQEKIIDIAIGSGGLTNPRLQRQLVGRSGYLTISEVPPENQTAFTKEEFLAREHLLVSSSGFVGAVDEALKLTDDRRTVAASTTHFATADLLLQGTDYITTIPSHAARALAARSGLFVSDCPVPMKEYPIEIALTKASLRDRFLVKVFDVVAGVLIDRLEAGRQ